MTHAFLAELGIDAQNFGAAAGPFLETRGDELVSLNPTTGKPIASITQAGVEEYETVMSRAVSAFEQWRSVPAPRRGEVVRQIGLALREKSEALGKLVSLEMGKIQAEGMGEVQEAIDMADFAVGLSRQLYGLSMHSERPGHRMYEQWHPLGPVGIITAFNFPVAVWAWNAMIALVCGDACVWKPSSHTPLCAIATHRIVQEVLDRNDCPPGLCGLVIGPGREIGERLINDTRVPLVSATGSCKMGRRVGEAIAKRLARAILELGGNNAIVVREDADMDLAVRGILFGAVGTTGQRCTSTRRIIAHPKISEELTRRLVEAYSQIRIGDPLDPHTLVGPLVNQAALDDMMAAMELIRAQGGEVLCGGGRYTEGACAEGFFVQPTIVKATAGMPIVKEETFAPILYILEAETLEEAIAVHNGVPQGLSSAIFTTDLRSAERFLSPAGSDCGIANVNIGTSGAEIGGAFGGEKETGGGREAGSDSWKAYMRRQTCTINYSDELPLAQGLQFG